jgi:intracellular septation protein
MQSLIDFAPLLAFFVAFLLGGIYVATGVLIVAIAIQIGWLYWRTRKVKTMHWVTGVVALVLGLATILLQDARFIQWKATVVLWAAALAFLGTQFIGERPLIRRMLEPALEGTQLDQGTWKVMNLAWAAFFFGVGALNLYVAWHFSLATWVNFKVFGVMALTLVFAFIQYLWLSMKLRGPESTEAPASGAASDERDA